ncbi:MAG: helix-turn-helix transcriptional regulator [Gelidibacter sp.]|nr:helix-turn-helix transcriptional regulator [Gelidibacter sp.]
MKSLNEFVRAKRKTLRLTQEELSNKAGVGLRFVRELERGKPTLKLDKVNQVLKLFGYELGPVQLNRNNLLDENS